MIRLTGEIKFRVFHRFRQAKFDDGYMLAQAIFCNCPAAPKNDAHYKSGRNRHKNNHLANLNW